MHTCRASTQAKVIRTTISANPKKNHISTHMSSSTLVQSIQPDHSSETLRRKTLMKRSRLSTTALLTTDIQVHLLTLYRAPMKWSFLPTRPAQREVIHTTASVCHLLHSVESSWPSTGTLVLVSCKKHTSAMSSSQMSTVTLTRTSALHTCQTSLLLTTANALMMLTWWLSWTTTVATGAKTMYHLTLQTMGSISKQRSESVPPTPTPIPIA